MERLFLATLGLTLILTILSYASGRGDGTDEAMLRAHGDVLKIPRPITNEGRN